jgi:hypothetical protein
LRIKVAQLAASAGRTAHRLEERADVFADPGFYLDRETAFSWHIKRRAFRIIF